MPGTRPGMTSLGSIAGVQSQIPDSVFKQPRPSLRGAKATKQSIFPYATTWIASRSLSSLRERYCARRGRAFARPVGSQCGKAMGFATGLSVAPRDIDGLLGAVTPGNRYGLRGAARDIGPVRRCDSRRESMCPIPGNIVCLRVMDIA
jgi:hypothetical protein